MKAEDLDYERGGLQRAEYTPDDVVAVHCPLCRDWWPVEALAHERGALGVVRCLACRLIYVSPRLRQPEQIYWGDPAKYVAEARLIFAGLAPHHRDPNYDEDLRRIAAVQPTGDLLDVGSNMGFFLRRTRGWGWRVVGIEPSPSLSALAREHFGLDVRRAFLETAGLPAASFDVVTMTDVFEHLTDPLGILGHAHRLLRPTGWLYVKVPNGLYSLAKQQILTRLGRAERYDIWDAYEHVVHYSAATLRRMLRAGGFEVVSLTLARPIQIPVWHRYVGAYFQYPSPWRLDWRRQSARTILYWAARLEAALLGQPGILAPNLVALAQKCPTDSGR